LGEQIRSAHSSTYSAYLGRCIRTCICISIIRAQLTIHPPRHCTLPTYLPSSMLRQRARVGGSGWVGVLVAGDICVCDAWLTVDVAWSLLARCVDGRYVWGFWFLARGEGTRCVFISWYSIEGTWFREPVASKHQKKYSAIPLAVFGVGVAVVDRKWIPPYPLPISPHIGAKKKDERFSRLAVLGPGRLLVLRLLCRR
jgi:hypothetical protein